MLTLVGDEKADKITENKIVNSGDGWKSPLSLERKKTWLERMNRKSNAD